MSPKAQSLLDLKPGEASENSEREKKKRSKHSRYLQASYWLSATKEADAAEHISDLKVEGYKIKHT